MALRGQPYLPLYVQDFMTDEKLNECSAESTGVYIRIMCVMHKSEQYGTITLKQKDKQNLSKIKNFACKLLKQMPYTVDVIERSLQELVEEGVLVIDSDTLFQKRMVKDANLSDIRAFAGSEGGKVKQNASKTPSKIEANTQAKDQAKHIANAEYEYDIEIESDGDTGTVDDHKNATNIPPRLEDVKAYCIARKNTVDPEQFINYYEARGWMAGKVKMKNWHSAMYTWEKNSANNPTKTEAPTNWAQDMMKREGK